MGGGAKLELPRGGGYIKRGKSGESQGGQKEGAKGGYAKGTFSWGVPKGVMARNVRRCDWFIPKGEVLRGSQGGHEGVLS